VAADGLGKIVMLEMWPTQQQQEEEEEEEEEEEGEEDDFQL
jgi:hypothetical protein